MIQLNLNKTIAALALIMVIFGQVNAPILLIIGDADDSSASNKAAMAALRSTKNLVVIPGVSNLLEDSSRLDEVGKLAVEWFMLHLQADVPTSDLLPGGRFKP